MRTRTSLWALVGCLLAGVAGADYLEIRRDTVIRADHDKNSEVLLDARPPLNLALEPIPGTPSDQRDGYYKVVLPDSGEHGWVYRTFVRRYPGPLPTTGGPVPTPVPSGSPLEVHVIDVGQADATYIRCPDGTHQMVIDAGDNRYPGSAKAFRAYIEARQAVSDPIEVVVATHPHADHIGSMDWLVDHYAVGLYLDHGAPMDTAAFRRAEEALSREAVPHWHAQDDVLPDIDFCPRADVSAMVLRPSGYGHDSDPNNNSVIIRVEMGGDSFLFVGDAETAEEELLLADPAVRPLLNATFLKVGHHGSHTSTTTEFLAAVTPSIASVSCGAPGVSTNSGYKHPRAEPIERLLGVCGPRQGVPIALEAYDSDQAHWRTLTLNRAVYVTTVEGDLVFHSRGTGIQRVTSP